MSVLLKDNKELLNILNMLVDLYPRLTFNNILYNFDYIINSKDGKVKNEFHLLPEAQLIRVIEACNQTKITDKLPITEL